MGRINAAGREVTLINWEQFYRQHRRRCYWLFYWFIGWSADWLLNYSAPSFNHSDAVTMNNNYETGHEYELRFVAISRCPVPKVVK